MKSITLATSLLIATSTAVFGADLSARYTKAPAPAYAPVPNWAGLYLGAFGGYGFGGNISAYEPSDGTLKFSGVKGGFGGITLGYNWQTPGSSLVWGLEADAAFGGMKLTYQDPTEAFGSEYKVNSFGSVTGRLGYAFDPFLLYVKGGYGWANAKLTGTDGVSTFTSSKFHSGYTIGTGAEMMISRNWSGKVEYMFADYGKATYGPTPDGDFATIGLKNHTIKAGVNYRF